MNKKNKAVGDGRNANMEVEGDVSEVSFGHTPSLVCVGSCDRHRDFDQHPPTEILYHFPDSGLNFLKGIGCYHEKQ